MEKEPNFKLLDKDEPLKMGQDLYEIQRTIIYFSNIILKDIKTIKDILQKEKEIKIEEVPVIKQESMSIIGSHINKIKIPEGYGGNNLKW